MEVERRMVEARVHLKFVVKLYKKQLAAGRHFLHEHPAGAKSWDEPYMVQLLENPSVKSVVSHQCEYGLTSPDEKGVLQPVKKPTRWMSSSERMISRLSRRCSGTHTHQHLVGGRAAAAAFYPNDLMLEILRGMRDEAEFVHNIHALWESEPSCQASLEPEESSKPSAHVDREVNVYGLVNSNQWSHVAKHEKSMMAIATMKVGDYSPDWIEVLRMAATVPVTPCTFRFTNGSKATVKLEYKDQYKDEYTGEVLPTVQIQDAIRDELNYFCDNVWRGCTMSEAHSTPDSKIIPSRWVLCNKGDAEHPDVRARLVGCEINTYKDDSFYASTPPLEAKRMLLSEFATQRTKNGKPLQLSFVDIRKAYFHGVPKRALFVRLPKELGYGPNMVARLDKCMYGTRDAAGIWECCYSDALVGMGFVAGGASPCCFYHPVWEVSIVVHGDDFTALGTKEDLDRYERELAKVFELKIRGRLGEGPKDDKEIRILNRIVRMLPNGIAYEADPRHAEMLMRSLGIEEAKPVLTPGVKQFHETAGELTMEVAADSQQVIVAGLITEAKPRKSHKSGFKTRFDLDVHECPVTPYSTIYGIHPRFLVATRHGCFKQVSSSANPFTGKRPTIMEGRKSSLASSGRLRSKILEHVLNEGAAWEVKSDEILSKVFGVKKKNSRLGAKAVKQAEKLESVGFELDGDEATKYRALAARANYLAMDRPELGYASKELCRDFAKPTKMSWDKLKRLVKFLVGQPRLVMWYGWQTDVHTLDVYTDTDFAGCQVTRRSTSGGIGMRGAHPIKHWSQTQSTCALSSGEAELTGICKGASIGMGLRSVAKDLGLVWELRIHSDATAAIGICHRKGLGKIRHLAVADLWIQDKVRSKDFALCKVLGLDNPADMLTKHVNRETIDKHMKKCGLYWEDGRAESAPALAQ